MEQYIMYLRKSQMDKDFEEESVEEELPDDLIWFSYWRTATRGAIECIEINKATRAIHCQGCLDVLFDMIAAGLVEKQPKTEPIITYGGFFGGNGNYTIDYKIL